MVLAWVREKRGIHVERCDDNPPSGTSPTTLINALVTLPSVYSIIRRIYDLGDYISVRIVNVSWT